MKTKGNNAGSFAHGLRFRPYAVDHVADAAGHAHLSLDPEFPFVIEAFSYELLRSEVRLTWHNWLEIFFPYKGYGSFRLGEQVVEFKGGDVLVIDNMKLHGVINFEGAERLAIVLFLKAELFYNLGSPLCDFGYLAPFYGLAKETVPILQADNPCATAVHEALGRLFKCWFDAPRDQYFKIGCKTYLSEVLYQLSRGLGGSELARAEYGQRREQAQRLGALVEYLNHNYCDKITVPQAAAMVGMSHSHFMRFFKQIAGRTFIEYLTLLRVTRARQLLRNQTLNIADISALVGFADQSYFDKRFKEHFGKSPRECREAAESL